MKASSLLRLYPRAWRDRYGDELLAMVGDRPLELPQIIDLVSGAIDAHLSSDVHATTVSRRHAASIEGGSAVIETMKTVCLHDRRAPFSKRDAWIGASVMISASIALSALGIAFDRAGFDTLSEAVMAAAFPVSVLLTMPFTFVKGQSWKSQGVLVGIPLVIVILLTWLAVGL
jgi:hypothetical protein